MEVEADKGIRIQEKCIVCFENECANGGVCGDPEETFDCQCPAGFEDPICFTNIDECAFNRCVNGVCIDEVASDTCEELKIKRCKDSPCQHGATCVDVQEDPNNPHDDLYTCDCTMGYTGQNCQDKKDFCVEFNQPCRNNATCTSIDAGFTYKCTCLPGFTGKDCETNINECASRPCLHSGRCIDLVDTFRCDCSGTGYQGDTCQSNINECEVDNGGCQNGRCRDLNG